MVWCRVGVSSTPCSVQGGSGPDFLEGRRIDQAKEGCRRKGDSKLWMRLCH